MKIFGCSLVVAFITSFLIVACKSLGSVGPAVKTGLTAAGEVCTFIEEFVDSGVLQTVCATANEIAQFGHNIPAIAHHRQMMARSANAE